MPNRAVNFAELFVAAAQGTTIDQHDAVLAQTLAAHYNPDASEAEIEARGALIDHEMQQAAAQ